MAELLLLDPNDIAPWPGLNPRRRFTQSRLDELTASVKEKGVLQPLLVHNPDPESSEGLWVVAGETRWRAAVAAGVPTVPCMVRTYTRGEALEVALLENLQRQDLTPVEEARGFRDLIQETGITQAELAGRVGKSQPYIANRIRLLDLPDVAIDLIDEGIVPPATVRDLLLPFAAMGDEARAPFFSKVAEALRKQFDETPLSAEEVKTGIRTVGGKYGKPVSDGNGYGQKPLVDRKTHDQHCPCKAPQFQWDGYYGGGQKTMRCLDVTGWLERAESEAKRQAEEKLTADRKRLEVKAAEISSQPVVDKKEFQKVYGDGYGSRSSYETLTGYDGGFQSGLLIDPSKLPADSVMAVQEDDTRGGPGKKRVHLVCTRPGSVRALKGQASKEINRLFEELKAKRLEKDLVTITKMPIDDAIIVDLVAGVADRGYSYSGETALMQIAAELGLDIGTHSQSTAIRKAPAETIVILAKLYALRMRRKDYGDYGGDDLKKKAEEQLRKQWEPMLKAMMPASAEIPAAPKKGARARRREKAAAAAPEVVDA